VRIVSLVPSATETLLAWGIVPVAVTRFCEHPELPQVGGTKDPDVAAILALTPDLVVLCEEENRIEDATALASGGVRTHVVRIDGLDDVAPQLSALAAAVGVAQPPAWSPPSPRPVRARAFVPIWRRPWMTMSGRCYGSSMLASLGVENVTAASAERYPEVTLDHVRELHPDVVIAPSEPYPFGERQRGELETVAPVVFVDGQDLFWWGTRTPHAWARLDRALAGEDGSARR
jgi:ABC-type Fe3+-hydroxamate transport system substrate-binding protein